MQLTLRKLKQVIKTVVIPDIAPRSKQTLGATSDSWKNSRIPKEQLKLVDKELEKLHSGNPPSVYKVAAEALKAIPGDNRLTLLDMGCASGYYSEVISTLTGERFEYTGADYSDAMLAVARKRYPDIRFMNLDIRHIDLPDKSYDVVLSGAVIVHVEEWKEAIRELTRITRSFLILHRTPVTNGKSYRTQDKGYAGVPIFFNTYNKNELVNLMSGCSFKKIFERNVYPHDEKGLGYITYVFERLK